VFFFEILDQRYVNGIFSVNRCGGGNKMEIKYMNSIPWSIVRRDIISSSFCKNDQGAVQGCQEILVLQTRLQQWDKRNFLRDRHTPPSVMCEHKCLLHKSPSKTSKLGHLNPAISQCSCFEALCFIYGQRSAKKWITPRMRVQAKARQGRCRRADATSCARTRMLSST
jgi:hypothetical protein